MIKKNTLRIVKMILFFSCFILSGCNQIPDKTINNEILPTATATLIPTTLPDIPEPEKTTFSTSATTSVENQNEQNKTEYSFVANLDYNKHLLDVAEDIQYWNNSNQSLDEVVFIVSPNQYPGAFILQSLGVGGDSAVYQLNGIELNVDLPDPLLPGDSVLFNLRFQLELPSQGGVFGYTDQQMNFSDWYPYIAPYNKETGWISHQPAEVGESLVYDLSNFKLTLTVMGNDQAVIAGSSLTVPTLDGCVMNSTSARNITFSVSDSYQLLSKQFGNITVNGYVFKDDESSGWAAVENTGQAILLFSEMFGVSYPHETMTVVESDFSDGMEYDGLYYLSQNYFKAYEYSLENYLTLLSVHETAHQWWYGIVGNDQALQPWLDESLATYSEYLYLETYAPDLKEWWWEYRVNSYSPTGNVDMTIYDQSDRRTYINAVYLRGALFLHELRQILGDELFFTNLRLYLDRYKYQVSNTEEFLNTLIPLETDATISLLQEYFSD